MAEHNVNRAGIMTKQNVYYIYFIFCDVVSGLCLQIASYPYMTTHNYYFFIIIIFILFMYRICKKDKTCVITIIIIHFYSLYVLANMSSETQHRTMTKASL